MYQFMELIHHLNIAPPAHVHPLCPNSHSIYETFCSSLLGCPCISHFPQQMTALRCFSSTKEFISHYQYVG